MDALFAHENALFLSGEFDLARRDWLRQALARLDCTLPGVVDLTAVTYLEANTLSVLIEAHRRFQARGGALTIVVPQNQILRIFEVTGLDRGLTVVSLPVTSAS